MDEVIQCLLPVSTVLMGLMIIAVSYVGNNLAWLEDVFFLGGVIALNLADQYVRSQICEHTAKQPNR